MSWCVLVVEDEVLVNMFISGELRVAGYEVLTAFDADEAIRILEKRNDIDLVFTDIDMPGSMDGLTLAAAIKSAGPRSKSSSQPGRLRLRRHRCLREVPLF